MDAAQETRAPAWQGEELLRALAALPGGAELLALAADGRGLELVGGAVRDLLLGRRPRELDIAVERDAGGVARELAARLPAGAGRAPEVSEHERFGTAAVDWIHGRIDVAERRSERYERPGALPEVAPGTPAEDLARRDFTVNAIALALGGPERGTLRAVEHARDDLVAGRLRVLHERSFIEDPTRLLRLARYSARLGFEAEAGTARLIVHALGSGALENVSGGRIAAELWLFAEEATAEGFVRLGQLGMLEALRLPATFDGPLLVAATALLPSDGSVEILRMAVLFGPLQEPDDGARRAAAALMDRFEFPAETRRRVLAAAFGAPALVGAIAAAERPSQLRRALAGAPVEAIAIAAAIGGRRSPEVLRRAQAWLAGLREVELEIAGADLLAAGIPEGPEIGRRLERTLDLKLDGRLEGGRADELKAALESTR